MPRFGVGRVLSARIMTSSSEISAAQPIPYHVREITRLAGPVIVARSGMMLMSLADTIMVGQFSAEELAYQSIGIAPIIVIMVTGFGLLQGVQVMAAYNYGAGNYAECGATWRRGMFFALVAGFIGLGLTLMGEPFLALTGQTADLSRGGGAVIVVIGYGLPFTFLYNAGAYFLEGIKRPKAAMYLMFAANGVNLFLNWIFIYGNLGAPALGAVGSAWATTGVRIFMTLAVIAYIWWLVDRDRFAIRRRAQGGWRSWQQMRRIGYGAGASSSVESAAFASLNLMAGILGTVAVAAFAISLNVLAIFFMIALGLGSATAVCVGAARGRHQPADMIRAGWTGLALAAIALLIAGTGISLSAEVIARAYTSEAALLMATVPVIVFLIYVLPVDGGQIVLANALRGLGETWMPAVLHVIAYLLVMIPLGWWLAFRLERGLLGLFEAIFLASIVSCALQGARFWQLAKRSEQQTGKA